MAVMAVMKRILPFMQSPKCPGLEALAVLMMGTNKGVKEAHYHDSMLKNSQEHSGDQVM